jgi:hypothetical protein
MDEKLGKFLAAIIAITLAGGAFIILVLLLALGIDYLLEQF